MATFSITLNMTYSANNRANAVVSDLQTIIDAHPGVTATVSRSGGTVTMTGSAASREDAEAFLAEAVVARSQYPHTEGFGAVTRDGEL